MLSPVVYPFWRVVWCSQLYQKFALSLINTLRMYNMYEKLMRRKRTWSKLPFFLNRFFSQIWLFEVSNQKIKFDGMFKMPGRDFEKISFSTGKVADPQNPGFKSGKVLHRTLSYQLYYLWSTFGVVSNDFDEVFKEFERLCRVDKTC